MQFRAEHKWDQTAPITRARLVAARKLIRAAEKGEDVQVILRDPELIHEAGGDPLPVVSEILVGVVSLPETQGTHRDWYSRALMAVLA